MANVARREEHSLPVRQSQRTHRKSRNGCMLCKKRRVKCDEAKPACRNCVKFSVECNYGALSKINCSTSVHSKESSDVGAYPTTLTSKRKRGRPRRNWATSTDSPSPAVERQSDQASPSEPDPKELAEHLNHIPPLQLDDLELLHHYTISTSAILGDGPIHTMYRDNVPILGFKFPFILRLSLALAARHLQRLRQEDRSKHCATLAEQHFAVGLAHVMRLLPNLDADNCQALYMSSILICLYTFASGPTPGEYLVFSESGRSEFLPLLRGIRSIIESLGSDVVFQGALAPMHGRSNRNQADSPTAVRDGLPRVRWEEPFQALRKFVSSSRDRDAVKYCLPALDSLSRIFEATYGNDSGEYHGDAHDQIVFRWLYCLEADFITQLEQKKPIALIICGYFALLLKFLELQRCWFIHGWAEHILFGIRGIIGPEYRVWLHWPMEKAEIRT